MLIAINYHYVRLHFDAPYPSIFGVTPAQFAAQLALLGRFGEYVSAPQIRAAVNGRQPLPERALVVTFDDGLQEQYLHAWPVLKRMGIPAIFFVNTAGVTEQRVLGVHKTHIVRAHTPATTLLQNIPVRSWPLDENKIRAQYSYDTPEAARLKYLLNFVLSPAEREELLEHTFADLFPDAEAAMSENLYMTIEQIRELDAHDCLGSHSHDHLPLGLLDKTQAARQIKHSLDWLESWTGRRPYALSYPYGSREASTQETGEVAAQLGIEFAFTIECAGNKDLRTPLWLARCDCNDLPGGKAPRWNTAELFDSITSNHWFA